MARYGKIFRGDVRKVSPYVEEAPTSAALAPGSIVELDSSGEWALHGAAGTGGELYVLSEDYLGQKNADVDILDGDVGVGFRPLPPYIFAALVATGNDITARDTALASAGNGVLRIAQASDIVLFYAQEVYNNNTGSSQLVRVRPANREVAV